METLHENLRPVGHGPVVSGFRRRGQDSREWRRTRAPGNVPFDERLRGPFPWVEFLKPADRAQFARDIVDVARACAAVSRFDRLLLTMKARHATAEATAAGYTHDDDVEWLAEPGLVNDPRTA